MPIRYKKPANQSLVNQSLTHHINVSINARDDDAKCKARE